MDAGTLDRTRLAVVYLRCGRGVFVRRRSDGSGAPPAAAQEPRPCPTRRLSVSCTE